MIRTGGAFNVTEGRCTRCEARGLVAIDPPRVPQPLCARCFREAGRTDPPPTTEAP